LCWQALTHFYFSCGGRKEALFYSDSHHVKQLQLAKAKLTEHLPYLCVDVHATPQMSERAHQGLRLSVNPYPHSIYKHLGGL
jgi:hypothetical protein